MNGSPPHHPLVSMTKYMPPSRRKEKQPIHITYDRDLEKDHKQHFLNVTCNVCTNYLSIQQVLKINNTQRS